jgi:hypothetical protein
MEKISNMIKTLQKMPGLQKRQRKLMRGQKKGHKLQMRRQESRWPKKKQQQPRGLCRAGKEAIVGNKGVVVLAEEEVKVRVKEEVSIQMKTQRKAANCQQMEGVVKTSILGYLMQLQAGKMTSQALQMKMQLVMMLPYQHKKGCN